MADQKILTSKWGDKKDKLSPHLIAKFKAMKRGEGGKFIVDDSSPVVEAPLTECNMEMAVNWQSPFENTGAESSFPAITAMLQTGALTPFLNKAGLGESKFSKTIESFAGKSGVSKLNSTQAFTGMPPVKIQAVALFRAWSDPKIEVEAPFDQLMQWSLPEKMAEDGTILSMMNGEMLPSTIPVCISMTYKGRTYEPLVIESISHPMGSPVDKNGDHVELLIPLTLCTLTALDRKDWKEKYQKKALT